MKKRSSEIGKERRSEGESWDNEGGSQSSNVPAPENTDEKKVSETGQHKEIPIPKGRTRNAIFPATLFSSTYFMKLWNAGTRKVKRHRLSERRNKLSINPDNLRDRNGFAKESGLTLARNRDR
jgi:hypothetical protein